jgi:DNA-binding XRE family transcriptional regulator
MNELDLPAVRKMKGLTQADVAKELGMSRLTYNQREKDPDMFTLFQWKKLAVLLDFDPANVNIKRMAPCPECNGTGLVEC